MAKQPFVPVPGVVRIRYIGTNQGSNWVNGLCVEYQGIMPTEPDLNTFATTMRTLWGTHLAGLFMNSVSLVATQVWDISNDGAANGQDSVSVTGTVATGTSLPVNAAVCVSWPVQRRWRGGHFRTYLPARSTGDLVQGRTLASAYDLAITNAMTAFRTAVNQVVLSGSTVSLGGVRYFPTGFDANGDPLVKNSGDFFHFNVPVVHGRLDTQRRRMGKELG